MTSSHSGVDNREGNSKSREEFLTDRDVSDCDGYFIDKRQCETVDKVS